MAGATSIKHWKSDSGGAWGPALLLIAQFCIRVDEAKAAVRWVSAAERQSATGQRPNRSPSLEKLRSYLI